MKMISLFLAGSKRSWLIHTEQEDDFKSSTTLKKNTLMCLFSPLIFENKAFMKQGCLAQVIGEIPPNSLCINVSHKI